ncbi:conjugative coupling factor TraD, PFGI-1 class, partial [Pseudomonas aeruginosa]|nr:conjugative coupling factor TraD, PFGI-1 class [Pseudomonas aeruginosa]
PRATPPPPPRSVTPARAGPAARRGLCGGRAFGGEQNPPHGRRQPSGRESRRYAWPPPASRLARRLEERLEFAPFPLSRLPALTGWDVPFNPGRPLPPGGGLPRFHGIEPGEGGVSLPIGERVGHSLGLGTTPVGKSPLAGVFVAQ